MIQFENATRKYGEKIAVSDLELTIPAGELFALLGPNGAGKTTTIKMLVGLLQPSRGVVRVCGHDLVSETRSAHSRLGYVPDEPYLYDKLTGHEFLRFIAGMYRTPKRLTQAHVDREIKRFELQEFADDLAENYSLGMRQRLIFAAAFLHDPEAYSYGSTKQHLLDLTLRRVIFCQGLSNVVIPGREGQPINN